MTLNELLGQFDQKDKKGFYFSQIATSMRGLDEKEQSNPCVHFEWVAFMLQPRNDDKDWDGSYYGPHFSGTNENGDKVDTPSFNDITGEAVEYWEARIDVVSNPLLRMRYADLAWNFKPLVIQGGKRSGELYRKCIESMITVCEDDYCSHPVETVNVLERLFSIAKSNSEDLQRVKDAYIRFESKYADDKSVRCWASRFLLMLENKKLFTTEEIQALVKEHEERLLRQSTPDKDGNLDPWLVEKQAVLLADYYSSGDHKDDIRRVLHISEESFMKSSSNMHPLQRMGNLENVYHRYLHYGLKEEADRLSVELARLGKEAKDKILPQTIPFTIPKELFEQYDILFGKGAADDKERWKNFSLHFIPRQEDEKESLEALSKQYPLVYMMGTRLMDSKGRPMSQVGSYESDPDGRLVLHIAQKLNLTAFAINIAVQDMIAAECFTRDKVLKDIIEPSPLFDEQRYDIIGKAIDFYLKGEYSTACHLLVPQIENAICSLVELCGESVLRPQRNNDGFQLKTLDDLLRTRSVSQIFTEDGAFYLRLVLTDQRAMNLRNQLCHGILPPEQFGVGAADRLLHVLVLLGMVRFVDE